MRPTNIPRMPALAAFWLLSQALAAQTPPPVVGTWHVVVPPEAPSSCQDVSVEFRGDGTIHSRSGALVATNTYSLRPEQGRWLLVEDSIRTNGQPNCQGLPADFVVQHIPLRHYVLVVGDTLKECRTDDLQPGCLTLVRRRGGSPTTRR
jgi:hypothetical protein